MQAEGNSSPGYMVEPYISVRTTGVDTSFSNRAEWADTDFSLLCLHRGGCSLARQKHLFTSSETEGRKPSEEKVSWEVASLNFSVQTFLRNWKMQEASWGVSYSKRGDLVDSYRGFHESLRAKEHLGRQTLWLVQPHRLRERSVDKDASIRRTESAFWNKTNSPGQKSGWEIRTLQETAG